jgi:hypothetical protein
MSQVEESWWDRHHRLYGYKQSTWWAQMPIEERITMVADVIEGGAIPVFCSWGGNALWGRGATHQDVADCVVALLDRNDTKVVEWFDWLQSFRGDGEDNQRMVRERGPRAWLMSLDSI